MKQAIVVGTAAGRSHWLADAMASLDVEVVALSTTGFELGKIRWMYENTNFDRFIFLQDSLVIRNQQLLAKVFEAEGSACLMCEPRCLGSYLGLYERKVLDRCGIATAETKKDAIRFEVEWTAHYIAHCDSFTHPVPIHHQMSQTVMRHGRENLLYVNDLYEKWKGDWGQIVHQ